LSRSPHCNAQLTDKAVEKLILHDRRIHGTWGPRKLRDLLLKKHGIGRPPSCSTIGAILKRNGMVKPRRRRPGVYPVQRCELTEAAFPNHVWTIDFKGWFLLGNGMRCDPLTVKDLNSHFMIGCRAMPNQQFGTTWLGFKRMARVHGLPQIIRVDHGVPFSAYGLGRLSRLSIWWIEQGIAVEFTRPASPQDNGSHERMHRDLKAEATQPPSANLRAQHRRFQRWVYTYNHERPHAGI
jgi:putative transposase